MPASRVARICVVLFTHAFIVFAAVTLVSALIRRNGASGASA